MGGTRPKGIREGQVSIKRIQGRLSQSLGRICCHLCAGIHVSSVHLRGRDSPIRPSSHQESKTSDTWPYLCCLRHPTTHRRNLLLWSRGAMTMWEERSQFLYLVNEQNKPEVSFNRKQWQILRFYTYLKYLPN